MSNLSIIAMMAIVAVPAFQGHEIYRNSDHVERYENVGAGVDSCRPNFPLDHLAPDMREELGKEVEACHKKRADEAAAAALRQSGMAAQEAEQQAARLQEAEAHKLYLEAHRLTQVSVVDLQANGKDMVGGHVALTGYVRIFNEDKVAIYTTPNDVNGVRLNLTEANPKSRRLIFSRCSDVFNPCKIEIAGTIDYDGHVFVQVE